MSMLTMTPEQYAAHQVRVKGARTVRLLETEKQKTGPKPKVRVKRVRVQKTLGTIEDRLAVQLEQAGFTLERQYAWLPGRRYRADFAHPQSHLIIELDGAAHRIKGRFHDDILKSQDAVCNGWRLLRIASSQVRDRTAAEIVRKAVDVAMLHMEHSASEP